MRLEERVEKVEQTVRYALCNCGTISRFDWGIAPQGWAWLESTGESLQSPQQFYDAAFCPECLTDVRATLVARSKL